MRRQKLARGSDAQKVEGNRGDEDQECDGRTVLTTVDRKRNEGNVRKENTKKKATVAMANLTPDDRDVNGRTTTIAASSRV